GRGERAGSARALADDRTERWPSMSELIAELDAAAEPPIPPRRHWTRAAFAVSAVAAVAALVVAKWSCGTAIAPIDVATATCHIDTTVPIVDVPPAATISVATCGGPVLVTASAPSGGRHAITTLDGPVLLAPPT